MNNTPNSNQNAPKKPRVGEINKKIGGARKRRRPEAHRGKRLPTPPKERIVKTRVPKSGTKIPPLKPNDIRIIPLGGVEQVGQNMTAIEYKGDIIIIDAGVQFSSDDTPGIDCIIPNTAYLEERRHLIRGIFITHGHLDHIGAIPYVIEKLGNPPIYTREFGAMMMLKRHEEFPHLPKLKMNILDGTETVRISPEFAIKSFAISHTIPDSMGLIIETPMGDIVFIEDVRVDNVNGVPTNEEVEQYKRFGGKEALLLTMDSTSIEKPGFSLSETTVVKNIEKIIKDVPGRLIIGTFASQVERILAIIEIADQYGKKVAVEGRSMKANVDIVKQLGLLKTKNLIQLTEIDQHPPHKVVMIVTGAQGEEFAALMRMSNKTHKQIKLNKTDTILLSSSIIPGNEKSITKLKDNLYRSDAKVITYLDSDVHASGHGNRDELKWIHNQIKYRFFMPLHGHHFMLRQHAELSMSLGTPKENIVVPDNGSIIEITDGGKKITVLKEKAPSNIVMVDGFEIGGVQDVVIRDRQALAQDGIFVIIATVDSKTGKLKKSPDIIARGFVYLKEAQDLLRGARTLTKKTVEEGSEGLNPINFDLIKNNIVDNISRFLYQKTAKRPLVIPVIINI